MMVVVDPIFEESGGAGGFNTPNEALFSQNPECVVNSLTRNGTDLSANVLGNFVRRAMWPSGYRPHNGQALGRNLETVFAKQFGWIATHHFILGSNLDKIKEWIKSTIDI